MPENYTFGSGVNSVDSQAPQQEAQTRVNIHTDETLENAPTEAVRNALTVTDNTGNKILNVFQAEPKTPNIDETITQQLSNQMSEHAVQILDNESVKDKVKKTVVGIIGNKVDTVAKKAEGENREASSELEEEALACFGYKPGKSIRKFQTRWAGGYHAVLSCLWMFVAMFTFAPIAFIAMKVHRATKVSWWGILLGLIIWIVIITTPILLAVLK